VNEFRKLDTVIGEITVKNILSSFYGTQYMRVDVVLISFSS